MAGASSVVALGVGLLIGAFAINTGGNEFAYQVKSKKSSILCYFENNSLFSFMIFVSWIKEYDGNAEDFLKNNIDNMSIRNWLGRFLNHYNGFMYQIVQEYIVYPL